ncbi:YcjF family protein [Schinkia sp. CFF1]
MQSNKYCQDCNAKMRTVLDKVICPHCNPIITTMLEISNTHNVSVGDELDLALDFETSGKILNEAGNVIGTISKDILTQLKQNRSFSFEPLVFQKEEDLISIFFYPHKINKVSKPLTIQANSDESKFEKAKKAVAETIRKHAEKKHDDFYDEREKTAEKVINEREHEADAILNENISEKEKVQKITIWASGICAGIAIQPIPFADIFILTPIQAVMALKIGQAKGIPITKKDARSIIIELGGVVGMGYLAQQTALQLLKFIPGGSLFTIPYVFGTTFAMGKVCEYYYDAQLAGKTFSNKEANQIFKQMLKEGKKFYEKWKRKDEQ